MTGIEIHDSGDGIWDDGEWISWEWINSQIDVQENGPPDDVELEDVEDASDDFIPQPGLDLEFRILAAKQHHENTLDVISPDWGPIGEAYLEECFGVTICRRHAQGHDGRLGDNLIEIKTISPHKRRPFVTVKRAGNFNVLAVVRIANDGLVAVRFVRREQLPPGNGGKWIVVTWTAACRLGTTRPPWPADEQE